VIKFSLIISFLLLASRPQVTIAQSLSRYNSLSYGVNEGLLQSTSIDLEFDQNNCWWISYPNGIQRFDGKKFVFIATQPGLPDNKLCYFFRSANGTLLISHTRGISRYRTDRNSFELVFTYDQPVTTPSSFVGESGGLIYFYTENAEITGIRSDNYQFKDRHPSGLPDYKKDFIHTPRFADTIIDGKTAFSANKKIYIWDLKKGKPVFESDEQPGLSAYFLQQISSTEILFYTYQPAGTLKVLNTQTRQIRLLRLPGHEQTTIGRCNLFRWGSKHLLSINDRLYETDAELREIRSEMVNLRNEPLAWRAAIAELRQDHFGNLFIRTITGGLRKVSAHNYPIQYYSTGEAGNNFILAMLADKKNNRILAGAANEGLLVFDTLQQLVSRVSLPALEQKSPSPNTILKSHTGDYYIFALSAREVFKLGPDLRGLKRLALITRGDSGETGIGYFCKLIYQDREKAVVISETHIYRVDLLRDRVEEYPTANGYIMSGVYSKPYFIFHYNDVFTFLHESDFRTVKRIPFGNTGGIRSYLPARDGKFYAGTNKGLFLIDTSGRVLQHMSRETGLPDECIYAMAFDRDSAIWCSTNKGLLKVRKGSVLHHIMKRDGLQESEFNTNVVATAEDGELFFGGINGFNSFFPANLGTLRDSIRLLVTDIQCNNEPVDSPLAAWETETLRLSYRENALSFDFVAMGHQNPDQYIYQYRMQGADNRWIQNDNLQTVRYSLSPGRYVFQVYASRTFDKDATPMKEIHIHIRGPWWQSWWFLGGLGLVCLGLLTIAVNRRIKRRYESQLLQLENERKIRDERERISRDLHDNLGAYAHAVLYNAERLEQETGEEKRKNLIADLKFGSKDIITALRETVWALKKEQYSAEDCLIRIKNFIQSLAKYYNQIQFRVEGEAPLNRMLSYTEALNLVRIMQEAVSNSIKHARASAITLTSEPAGRQWKLTVEDDGTGFDLNSLKEEEKGNGLNNMEHRAAASGFDLTIRTRPGAGTSITLIA
jgi:signal transduction histidine kinase